uniref:TonB-dependent receptor n=1 Tax=Granulicella aggregans TaxID=474949 RepID=UPI0021E0874F|nr:carboxypeptidase-like regulatory domain-containing protein [Granulicella aggregans]
MQSPTPQDQRSHSSYAFLESSKSKILLRYAVIVMALACAATSPLRAQFRTSVQGTVTDPQGAVIPGATVTLRDVANNAQTVRTSDGAGLFNFGALPPDNFTLTVEATGFQKKVLTNIKFIPEQPNSLNVALTLGASDLTIEVNASSTPTLDTETANTGGTISANDIQHIPSFNRDVFTLSQLAPGAISTGAQSSGGGVATNPGNQGPGGSGNGGSAPTENGPQVNSNGQQYGNNGISLDGISTVSAVWGGTSIITPSPEAVDNVRIVTNGYDAENGRFSGAETMVTTKSGTNQIHGSLFLDAHRPGLNAANRPVRDSSGNIIGASVKDTDRYNQYGGSVGGPYGRTSSSPSSPMKLHQTIRWQRRPAGSRLLRSAALPRPQASPRSS